MLNPSTQPRRHAAHVEREQATRLRALGASLNARQAANRVGISELRAEQLAAKYGFTYLQHRG